MLAGPWTCGGRARRRQHPLRWRLGLKEIGIGRPQVGGLARLNGLGAFGNVEDLSAFANASAKRTARCAKSCAKPLDGPCIRPIFRYALRLLRKRTGVFGT